MHSHLTGRVRNDERGAVAVLFGLLVFVLIGAGGAAVDVSRGLAVRTTLQSELDAALLAGAAQKQSNANADAASRAEQFFAKNWKARYQSAQATLSVTQGSDGKLSGTATASVPTAFMKLFGYDVVEISVESAVSLEIQDVEVALVLDTTGSMAGSKLAALQTAAKDLVDIVYSPAKADEHVKVSIVPFSDYVNVGLANRGKSWMSVPPDSSTQKEWCGDQQEVIGQSNCRMVSAVGYNDGVPYTYQYETCDYQYGPPVYKCTPYTETVTWNGCAGSRNYPLNTLDDQYSTPIPGLMNVWCPAPLTPLTKDKTVLKDQINALNATGETFIPSGLIWGWRVLSSQEPFSEAVPYGQQVSGKQVRKIMVLMTDGANTKSPTYPYNDGGDVTLANKLTTELCANVKAKGIEIFTIAFDVSDAGIKDILRGCASSADKHFDAASESALLTAFQTVAKDMMPLHIAK